MIIFPFFLFQENNHDESLTKEQHDSCDMYNETVTKDNQFRMCFKDEIDEHKIVSPIELILCQLNSLHRISKTLKSAKIFYDINKNEYWLFFNEEHDNEDVYCRAHSTMINDFENKFGKDAYSIWNNKDSIWNEKIEKAIDIIFPDKSYENIYDENINREEIKNMIKQNEINPLRKEKKKYKFI